MTILYSTQDRIPVEIDDMVFYFAPFSQKQKMEFITKIQSAKDSPEKLIASTIDMLKVSLKKVDGITRPNGENWILKLDEQNKVSDESIDELMNLSCINEIFTIAGCFVNSIPKEGVILNPQTGEPLKGVKVKKT